MVKDGDLYTVLRIHTYHGEDYMCTTVCIEWRLCHCCAHQYSLVCIVKNGDLYVYISADYVCMYIHVCMYVRSTYVVSEASLPLPLHILMHVCHDLSCDVT